jgi:hypothetical protein
LTPRRTNKDVKWLALKEEVRKRDKGCRLLRVLSAKDHLFLTREAGRLVEALDCAHVFGAGAFPHMIYNRKNVVLLNRYSHRLLDEYKNPVNGEPLNKEQHTKWWKRIVGEAVYEALEKESKNGREATMGDEEKVFVNEKETSKEELEELRKQKNIRLHEEKPGHFRKLERMTE